MERRKHGEFYVVKRLRLLQYLMERGYKAESTIPDPQNPAYNWWLIRNSAELEAELDTYFEALRK